MPERDGEQSCYAKDQREGQEVPLFPEEIDVCIFKKFHAAYDPFKTTIDRGLTTVLDTQCLAALFAA
jgi:hypothetical protein